MKVLVTQSCLTLCDPMDCSPPGFSIYGDSPGKNTGVSCHALLQRIFWTRVSCIAGRLLTIWATREPHLYWSYPSSLLLTPKLGAITSSPVFSYHFSLYDSILGFLYHVFFFFFFTFPWNLWRSVRHAAGVQETAARLKDSVSRVGHHSKRKMDSQGSKEIKIINSGFSLQTVGHDLLGAKISTWESETFAFQMKPWTFCSPCKVKALAQIWKCPKFFLSFWEEQVLLTEFQSSGSMF